MKRDDLGRLLHRNSIHNLLSVIQYSILIMPLLFLTGLCLLLQVIRLRKKLSALTGAADAVRGLFGVEKNQDEVVERLEKMQVC